MGRISPRRVISPVIATPACAGMPASAETIATVMVTPALGPSFGVAPSGTCTWMSLRSWKSVSMPSSSARLRTTVCAALIDSRITSPSWPV